MFAHSLDGRPVGKWEPLSHHLEAVGERAADFAAIFGWAETARVAGQLHDIGKCSAAFQAYIAASRDAAAGGRRGPDHSTAGARVAAAAYPGSLGRLLAFAIAGHHAGLADAKELERRLVDDYAIEPYDGWRSHCSAPPAAAALAPARKFDSSDHKGFSESFLTRMLFSCLVDADFLETEAFYARATGERVERGGHASIEALRNRLQSYMLDKRVQSPKSSINALRARVLDHALEKAALPPGLFTLTVPTGGGKTLASLSFALDHVVRHGMTRVIYVIPYTSIIEQTAQVFREALDAPGDVLEHHFSFDWERAIGSRDDVAKADDEGQGGVGKLRRAAENWDVPLVVTTAVQFFESLFANRTSRCRKLHNLAGAVIVLDEAQTLPINLLRPCMVAMDELCRNYGASVVLCTATQPALREKDGFKGGFKICEDRELAPDPRALYTTLKRVTVETLAEPTADTVIVTRFAEQPQMLCIVNSRAHARALFEMICDLPGATHLTTLMCPRHRRAVLQVVRDRLASSRPVRLVATSLIEAGVDVDFPEVWRAAAGLDSIAQAAGRCNREGRLESGRTVVFVPAEAKPPRALEAYWQATRPVLRKHLDLLGLDAVEAYFRELYWQKGSDALDAANVDGRRGVLVAIRERAGDFGFPFRSIAEAFRLIDDIMESVVVPWRANASDEDADRLLRGIANMDRPRAADLRRLQQYTVSIPRKARDKWLAAGALRPVHPALGEGLLCFDDLAHYRADTGLDIGDIGLRSVDSNIIT
jgi:CRISPR-associated endonuclease/helicase Cas3